MSHALLKAQYALMEAGPNESACPKMPTKVRHICFAILFVVGWILAIVACSVIKTTWVAFLVLYIIGPLMAFFSSFFLKNIKKQLEKMRQMPLIAFVVVFCVSYVVTIVVGAVKHEYYAVLFPFVVSFISLAWYTLSLVPCCGDCMNRICCSWCKPKKSK